MNWTDEIAGSLPGPRDDEPAGLRRDIADELGDHLQSALGRELRTVQDEVLARRNVLDRFGDPCRVAGELWYHAMKEKIMSQRLMLVFCAIIAVACLAALGMTWSLVRQNQENKLAMLDKIAALVPAPQAGSTSSAPSEWSAVKLRLVQESDLKSPAVGYKASLSGKILNANEPSTLDLITDAKGMVDFGLIRVGHHHLVLTSISGLEQTYHPIAVRPGQETVVQIACPMPYPETEVRLAVDWPEDLRGRDLWTICYLQTQPRQVGGREWHPSTSSHLVLIDSSGRVLGDTIDLTGESQSLLRTIRSEIEKSHSARWESHYDATVGEVALYLYRGHHRNYPLFTWQKLFPSEPARSEAASRQEFRMPAIAYKVTALAIVKPERQGDPKRVPLLGVIDEINSTNAAQGQPQFQPNPGQPNEWKIPIPDALAKQVRQRLERIEPSAPATKE